LLCSADSTGGAGANSFETHDAPSGTDPVATSATDTLTWTVTGPLVLTGTAGTDTMAFSWTGTFADAQIQESNVTQHEAALSITESQITDLDHPTTVDVNQATHGLSVGDAIHYNGSSWEGSDADASKPCHGVVVAVADVNNFTGAVAGSHTITTHGFTLGTNYISTTAAAVSSTDAGPGNIIQEILVAIDANTVVVNVGTPIS